MFVVFHIRSSLLRFAINPANEKKMKKKWERIKKYGVIKLK